MTENQSEQLKVARSTKRTGKTLDPVEKAEQNPRSLRAAINAKC